METVKKFPFGEIFRVEKGEVIEEITCSLCGKGFSGLEAEWIVAEGKCLNCGGSNRNPLTGKT